MTAPHSPHPNHSHLPACTPSRTEFHKLAAHGNLIPVWRDILADMETPVSAFKRIAHRPNAFLLESVEGGERMARYSFLGADPHLVLRSKGNQATITENGETRTVALSEGSDPLHILQEIMDAVKYVEVPDLPRFVGGAVGYIGYDWVRFLEPIGNSTTDDLDVDDVHLLLTDTLVIFDHVRHKLRVLANARIAPSEDVDAAYDAAVQKVESLIGTLREPLNLAPTNPPTDENAAVREERFTSNVTQTAYKKMVLAGKEYISAGDIIQVQIGQRFSKPLHAHPFEVYRALRSVNPSPYMFYLALENGPTLVGASPEILVSCENNRVTIRPLAGTRRRGATPAEDAALASELLQDEKERAEHIMLVDLARNDVGRVCSYGTIKVDELMVVERYSHVMHIVSNISGQLLPGKTNFDVLRATFPAGTLSGAPKVRAMQIIEELEPSRRGIYGGGIGYFSYNGNFDASITIRTAVIKDGIVHVQAAGGIVADSDPELEYEETVNKSQAVRRAVELAEAGLS